MHRSQVFCKMPFRHTSRIFFHPVRILRIKCLRLILACDDLGCERSTIAEGEAQTDEGTTEVQESGTSVGSEAGRDYQNPDNHMVGNQDFPLMGRTVVISRTMRKVFGWPIEMGLTPITCALTSFLSRYGFSSEDVRELLRLRIPRSTIAEKIVYLEQNWCWQEVKVRDVIKKDRHLLERKPASIISNMRKLDRKWGRHAAVDALRRDSYALMRNPSRMIASVHEIGEFMSSEFGLEAPPHGSWMGSRIYKTSLKQVRNVVDGLQEFLPMWCIRKMFSRLNSCWFSPNLTRMRTSYEALFLEILLPLAGNDAEGIAHVMIAKQPELLLLKGEDLITRSQVISSWLGSDTLDALMTRPRILRYKSSTLMEKWHQVVTWASANPFWYQELKEMTIEGKILAVDLSKSTVERMQFLSTFSMNLDRTLASLSTCTKSSFEEEYPNFKQWVAFKNGCSSLSKESEVLFEKFLLRQWRSCPRVLSVQRQFIPYFDQWLSLLEPYGLTKRQIVKIVGGNILRTKDPAAWNSPDILEFLEGTMGTKQQVGQMVYKNPWVLYHSSIRKKLGWLMLLEITEKELGSMLKMYPALIRCHLANKESQAKVDYLRNEMGRDPRETVSTPMFWGASLENRIKPRVEFARSVLPDLFTSIKIKDFVGRSTASFCKKIKRSIEEYESFRESFNKLGKRTNLLKEDQTKQGTISYTL